MNETGTGKDSILQQALQRTKHARNKGSSKKKKFINHTIDELCRRAHLAVVGEVGPEDVLHHGRVARVDLPPACRRQQPEGLAAAEQVGVVVVQPPDVVELVEHRAHHRRVPLRRLAAAVLPAAAGDEQVVVGAERQQREAGRGGDQ